MNKSISPTITYVVRTRFCATTNDSNKTEFNSDDSLKNRFEAFNFIENYLEIITNEGLIKIESNYIHSKAIDRVNTEISKPNESNYRRLKLLNQEAIIIIPNEATFPFGISLFLKVNKTIGKIQKDKEYELYSLKNTDQINFSDQLNNLINEYKVLKNLGCTAENTIELHKQTFNNLSISEEVFRIFNTPFLWQNATRQFFVNSISNKNSLLDCLYDRLFHYENFDYVNFLEKNCPKEIEKNIYAMLHSKGGLLYVGYHPENLTESILGDIELLNYYNLLDATFSKDEYLYKNINLQIFSFNDFPVLAITVFPLNEESKKNHAYNPDKIFVLQNNRFVKMKDI